LLFGRNCDIVVINHVLLGSGSYRDAISVASTTFGDSLIDRTGSDLCDHCVSGTHRCIRYKRDECRGGHSIRQVVDWILDRKATSRRKTRLLETASDSDFRIGMHQPGTTLQGSNCASDRFAGVSHACGLDARHRLCNDGHDLRNTVLNFADLAGLLGKGFPEVFELADHKSALRIPRSARDLKAVIGS